MGGLLSISENGMNILVSWVLLEFPSGWMGKLRQKLDY